MLFWTWYHQSPESTQTCISKMIRHLPKKNGKALTSQHRKHLKCSNATSERCRQIISSCERGDVRVNAAIVAKFTRAWVKPYTFIKTVQSCRCGGTITQGNNIYHVGTNTYNLCINIYIWGTNTLLLWYKIVPFETVRLQWLLLYLFL